MISILVKGCSFDGTYKYNLDGRGQIIGGNMAGTNSEELIREIGQWRKLRSTLDRAVAHLILSSAPEDPRMDDSTWAAIGERFAIEMGFENCARVVVRHDDAEQEHIHIVCSRIDSKGKTVHDANDRYRAERSLAGIEADFGLRRVNKLKSPISKKKRLPKGASRSRNQHHQKLQPRRYQ